MTAIKPVAGEPIPESQQPLATVNHSLPKQVNQQSWSFWTVFSSTFLTIFLAEMGDKTQLATLLMSAQSQSPWVVFAGAATALMATSLLGVMIGYWIAKRLPPKTLDLAVALLLLLITGLLIADVIGG